MKAITTKQPWAWLICAGFKNIENSTFYTDYRGPLYIHAGQKTDYDCIDTLPMPAASKLYIRSRVSDGTINTGGIIGRVELIDCVRESGSPWFTGPFGWKLSDPEYVPFLACKGQLGLWNFNHATYENTPLTKGDRLSKRPASQSGGF